VTICFFSPFRKFVNSVFLPIPCWITIWRFLSLSRSDNRFEFTLRMFSNSSDDYSVTIELPTLQSGIFRHRIGEFFSFVEIVGPSLLWSSQNTVIEIMLMTSFSLIAWKRTLRRIKIRVFWKIGYFMAGSLLLVLQS